MKKILVTGAAGFIGYHLVQRLVNRNDSAIYKIYNIGANRSVSLLNFIKILENNLGRKANKIFLPLQLGDVAKTWSNIDELVHDFNYNPETDLVEGLSNFVGWYKNYYGI